MQFTDLALRQDIAEAFLKPLEQLDCHRNCRESQILYYKFGKRQSSSIASSRYEELPRIQQYILIDSYKRLTIPKVILANSNHFNNSRKRFVPCPSITRTIGK